MNTRTRDAFFIITLVLLVLSVILLIPGIVLVSISCNSRYKDCTQNMNQVRLVDISTFNCGYQCIHPKYDFSFLDQPTMCSIIDFSKTNIQLPPENLVYNYNETYYVYTYSGYNMVLCDPNRGRENTSSNAGIIIICVSVPIILATAAFLIWNHKTGG